LLVATCASSVGPAVLRAIAAAGLGAVLTQPPHRQPFLARASSITFSEAGTYSNRSLTTSPVTPRGPRPQSGSLLHRAQYPA